MRALLAAILLAGCGPTAAEFVGTYEGELTARARPPCAPSEGKEAGVYVILAGPKIERYGSCTNVGLDVAGAVATIKAADCPADAVWPGRTIITGGTLTLTGKTLAFDMKVDQGCEVLITGTLTRK